jgi:DNA-binding CsgD family transcriptional regulator
MLYVKYLLREYLTVPIEVKADLLHAIVRGYQQSLLTAHQVTCLKFWIFGYRASEIAERVQLTTEQVQQLLLRAFRVIETLTMYTDQTIILKHKGRIQPEWIAKSDFICATEWE